MRNPKHLSDRELLAQTLEDAKLERKYNLAVLYDLLENEARKLYSSLGYSDLVEYCVEELKYSEVTARRRVSSMRALKWNPELGEKIESGEVNLTNVAQVECFLNRERKLGKKPSAEERRDLFKAVEGKSTRTVTKMLLAKNPQHLELKSSVRQVTPQLVQLTVYVNEEFLNLLEQAKGKLFHKIPQVTNQEALMECLKKFCQPSQSPKPRVKKESTSNNKSPQSAPALGPQMNEATKSPNTKAIPSATRRAVLERANYKCENCHSTSAVEIDHRIPRALGGSNELHNLRALCRSCNQRAAIQTFGAQTMNTYWQRK